jgi:hypothetical protein
MDKISLSGLNRKLRCVIHKDMKTFQELKNYYYKKDENSNS